MNTTRPLPLLTDINTFFWTAGEQGVLRFLQCQSCNSYVHPPLPACRECGGISLCEEAVSGRATVLGWTINHQPWHPAFEPPYVIAVVAIDEDPRVRLTTNLIDVEPDAIELHMAVEVAFERHEDVWLPMFRPVAAQ